jgi:hypothetical protein
VTIIDEIETFIRDHREHGELVGDATEPAANGYMITVPARAASRSSVGWRRWTRRSTARGWLGWTDEMARRDSWNLRAALGFLEIPPRAPELRLLHRWLDTWTGVGLITVGVERLGYRLSLSHIADGEWRAQFSQHSLWASVGYGVATTPCEAVQIAARAAVRRESVV